MKVLLRRNVSKLGKIGEVVEVKAGYARNYLIPEGLGIFPTEANIKAVEAQKQAYLDQLAREHAELTVKAEAVGGKTVTIVSRANEEGHFYGSIGPAQVAAALAEQGSFIDDDLIQLPDPVREVGHYDIEIRFGEEVSATIHLQAVALGGSEQDDEGDQVAQDEVAGHEDAASQEAVEEPDA